MALTARDQKKVGTYDFHQPADPGNYDERAIGVISIFQYGLNAKGDALKSIGTPYKIRFERGQTDQAIKAAKRVVKELNAGTYAGKEVTIIPTGRPKGRTKAALVAA
jgi:hypothetical protein